MTAPEPALNRKPLLETLVQRPALALPIFLLLGLLPGLATLNAPLFEQYDDPYATVSNPLIEHGFGYFFTQLKLPFLPDGQKEMEKSAHWAPLSFLSTAVDHAIFGRVTSVPPKPEDFTPWGFRLMTGLYHGLLGWLVWRLGTRLTGRTAPSIFAALVFLFHPTVCETVCWVIERNNVLPALFGALAFMVYARENSEEPGPLRLFGAVALLVLSQLSKASGISWCVLIVLWDLLFVKGSKPLNRAIRYAFLLLPAMLTVFVTLRSHHRVLVSPLGVERFGLIGPWIYFVMLFGRYISLLCWPVSLSAFYHVSPVEPPWISGLAGLALLAVLMLLAHKQGVPLKRIFFYGAWIALAVGPVINPKTVTSYPFQDRYVYPALPAFGLLLGEIIFSVNWIKYEKAALRGAAALLLAFQLLCVDRALVWRKDELLFLDATQSQPKCAFGWFYLADSWMYRSAHITDPETRLELRKAGINMHFKALSCDDYDRMIAPLYTRLKFALALVELGRIAEAREQFLFILNAPDYGAMADNSLNRRCREESRDWLVKLGGVPAP